VDKEMSRSKEFQDKLKRVGYQAERLADHPNVDLTVEATRNRVHKKSKDLMIAIIRLFNSYLLYFNHGFFGKGSQLRTDAISEFGKVGHRK
jgi:hypothetical protein